MAFELALFLMPVLYKFWFGNRATLTGEKVPLHADL